MSVFALIGTVSTEVSENSLGTPVVPTLLRFLLHCCGSNERTGWSRAHPGVRFAPQDGSALPWRRYRCWACIAGWCSADSRWRRSGSAAGWNGTPGSRSGPSGSLRFPTWWWADRWSTFQKTNLMHIDDTPTDTYERQLSGAVSRQLTLQTHERICWLTGQTDWRRWSWRNAGSSRCSIGPGARSTWGERMQSPAPSQRLQVTGGILKFHNLSRQSHEAGDSRRGMKKKTKKTDTDPYIMDIHPEPELIKLFKSKTENGTETIWKAVPQIYSISNNPFCPYEINNLCYKFLLQLQLFHNPLACFCQFWTGSYNLSEIPVL